MEKMNELTKRKKEIEEEIGVHLSILDSQGGVGMSEPLVDGEGFPRNDVDLVVVRQSRQRVICLRNDHKALMKEIEADEDWSESAPNSLSGWMMNWNDQERKR